MDQNDRRSQNRKLIGVIILFLVVCIIITILIININRENEPSPDDDSIETDSSVVEENYIDTETYAYTNHPISSVLPIIDDTSDYCISYDISSTNSGDYRFVLTIDYKTEEGKRAAKDLLKSPVLSPYNPSQYEIIYTKVEDKN
ncbi:hypothetical protein IKG06_01765 [Candidatus Saccharibacteria bacterium]|nr:hypothetical protein [Candidatus Saccharibacteria bacterium]